MIAFGTAMSDPEAYRRYAAPGIALAAEPDSAVIALAEPSGPARGANLLLETAGRLDDLEALVIVNERIQLTDPATCATVRAALADPRVAAAGCAGAGGAPTIAWWEGDVSAAEIAHRHDDHGGGTLPAYGWVSARPAPAQVDALDGDLLVLSPWAVRELRFDESLPGVYGHERDFCHQVQAAGRTLVTAPLPVIRHRPLKLVADLEVWVQCHMAVAAKWAGTDVDWKARARRAEARREAARTVAYSNLSLLDARVAALEADLAAVTETPSWRLTAPLRALNARRRARRG